MENGSIMVKEMKVEALMPERKRAQISILFERLAKDGRATHSKKVMNIMADIQSGKIVKCLDFGGMLDDSIVNKLCWDADPENFDTAPNDNFDCADNVAHLMAEVKSIYCRENGLIGDPTTGVCRPLDSNLSCPSGSYLRGYLPDGSFDCYTPEPPDPVVSNPSPNCWVGPTPTAFCNVAGPCGNVGDTQAAECEASGTWTGTMLNCQASSPSCAIYKEKTTTPAPSLCWAAPAAPGGVCLVSGSCPSLGQRTTTKCKDADGNYQAGYSLICEEADPFSCARGGACDANAWDSTKTAADICTGASETQTNECGDTRTINGEKNCSTAFTQRYEIPCGCTPYRQSSVTYQVNFSSSNSCTLVDDISGSRTITSGTQFTIGNRRDFSATLSCSERPDVTFVRSTRCPDTGTTECE